MTPDRDTRRWIKTAADEKAAAAGMVFDAEAGEQVCEWIESNCCLYEGEHAGEPLILLPYEREFVMRLFGWRRWSLEYGCWIRRFTKASLWCAKKNGKSPLLAAIGLYLTCGDGEPGQKVYTAAKNGDQAKIVQRHAFAMVEQSPPLRADCKLNRSTLQITHLPSRSAMLILTGDDNRGAKAKEGINGSILIDECHVFDREMHERTSRAGISRKEPLNLSVSTAGDDPSSYGFERCQYGRQVNAGDRDDPNFLHVEYAAPEKLRDSDIDERLDELGQAANPAWGHIVKPSEFRSDWQASKSSPREVARFKQYRLNLWVGSTNRWLDPFGWEKGRREYTLEDLRGRECFLGIDAARKLDMFAACFVFPWPEDGDECVRIWPMFWLPEQTAKERDHLFPFRSWGRGNHLTLTPGGTLDYSRVKKDLRDVITGHDLKVLCLYYDEHYANEITQALHEGEQLAEAIAPGVVDERREVKQSLMTLTGLACDVERRVKAGSVQHPDNLVMNWQVGHCEVYADRNQNIRPVKPPTGTGKNIDGIMAMLDGWAGLESEFATGSEPSITFI